MKKIFLFLVLLSIALTACKGPVAPDGSFEINLASIIWKGEYASEHELINANGPPQINWAYYNTAENRSYMYDGTQWHIIAEGPQVIDNPTRGSVIFTFDDDYIDEWYDLHQLLDNTGWRATFFLDSFHTYTGSQIEKLQKMQDYGHEMGHHGASHANAVEYVQSHGMQAYLENEIRSQKTLMAEHGFNATSFSYPFGSRNTQLDTALFNEFSIIRGIANETGAPASHRCVYDGGRLVFSMGIDTSYNKSMDYIKSLIDYARTEDKTVIFYAHLPLRTVTGSWQIEYLRMVELVKYINDNNVRFDRISDLAAASP